MMYCSHCGRHLTDNTEICPFCKKPVGIRQDADVLADLAGKARAGDQDAFAALYEKTYGQVFYTVKSMIKDEDAVFDILQDSYIKAFTHLEDFEGGTKFLPWVRQIAANTARDWLKKKRPTLFVELEPEDGQGIPVEEWFVDESGTSMPELVIDREETTRLVREIIEELPEDQRAVIGMFYYEELTVKEIAAAMGASESAVKSRLMYGRKKIEVKVRDLEKKGTKLYGLMPVPFLLLLFRSQKAYAGELPPNGQILQNILESTANLPTGTANAETAGTAKNAASETGTAASSAAGTTAAAAGGLGTTKIVLIVLASLALAGAGAFAISQLRQEDSDTAPVETVQEVPEEEEPAPPAEETEEVDPAEKALEQYRNIINQADTYQYDYSGGTTPTGAYRYALVRMQPEDPVPTLLLSQETTEGLYFVRVFQYDPAGDTVRQPEEGLIEGVSQAGGYRGGLGMMADGNGIRITAVNSGTGGMTISRVTLDGEDFHTDVEWEGLFTDPAPENLGLREIEWHAVEEVDQLDSIMDALMAGTVSESGEAAAPSEQTDAQAELPQDGSRIVFRGTIGQYSYDEVISLQGEPDPNGEWADTSRTFRLIVPDTPQTMEVSGREGLRSGEVLMIDVSGAVGLEQYDGQNLIFSIDPYNTYWPSDTSLPLGQPRTKDVKVIN